MSAILFDTYVFLECGKLLLQGVLVGEHVSQLIEHVLHPLHHSGLQILQVLLSSLLCEFILDLCLVSLVATLVFVEIFSEFGDRSFKVISHCRLKSSVSSAATADSTSRNRLDLVIKHGQLLVKRVNQCPVFVDHFDAILLLCPKLIVVPLDCFLVVGDPFLQVVQLIVVILHLLL